MQHNDGSRGPSAAEVPILCTWKVAGMRLSRQPPGILAFWRFSSFAAARCTSTSATIKYNVPLGLSSLQHLVGLELHQAKIALCCMVAVLGSRPLDICLATRCGSVYGSVQLPSSTKNVMNYMQ